MLKKIIEETKSIEIKENQLKLFSIILALLFIFFSTKFFIKNNHICSIIFLLLSLYSLISTTYTPLIKPIFIFAIFISLIIGHILSQIILLLLFIFIITPVSIIFKILKKDILDEKIDKNKQSYWNKITESETDFEKQY